MTSNDASGRVAASSRSGADRGQLSAERRQFGSLAGSTVHDAGLASRRSVRATRARVGSCPRRPAPRGGHRQAERRGSGGDRPRPQSMRRSRSRCSPGSARCHPAILLFLVYAGLILAGIGISLRYVIDLAIGAPVSGPGVVVMVLLAYTIFTTTLVLQRKEASRGLALGLASLTRAARAVPAAHGPADPGRCSSGRWPCC